MSKTIGTKIRDIRKDIGMTQQELAEKSNVSDAAINKYEKDIMKPKIDNLKSISEVLNVDISYFVNLEHKLYDKTVGERIKNIRLSKGLTLVEFGKLISEEDSPSDSIVSRWEKGVSIPRPERLKRIAEIGNVDVDYLLNGDEDSITVSKEEYNRLIDIEKKYNAIKNIMIEDDI